MAQCGLNRSNTSGRFRARLQAPDPYAQAFDRSRTGAHQCLGSTCACEKCCKESAVRSRCESMPCEWGVPMPVLTPALAKAASVKIDASRRADYTVATGSVSGDNLSSSSVGTRLVPDVVAEQATSCAYSAGPAVALSQQGSSAASGEMRRQDSAQVAAALRHSRSNSAAGILAWGPRATWVRPSCPDRGLNPSIAWQVRHSVVLEFPDGIAVRSMRESTRTDERRATTREPTSAMSRRLPVDRMPSRAPW